MRHEAVWRLAKAEQLGQGSGALRIRSESFGGAKLLPGGGRFDGERCDQSVIEV